VWQSFAQATRAALHSKQTAHRAVLVYEKRDIETEQLAKIRAVYAKAFERARSTEFKHEMYQKDVQEKKLALERLEAQIGALEKANNRATVAFKAAYNIHEGGAIDIAHESEEFLKAKRAKREALAKYTKVAEGRIAAYKAHKEAKKLFDRLVIELTNDLKREVVSKAKLDVMKVDYEKIMGQANQSRIDTSEAERMEKKAEKRRFKATMSVQAATMILEGAREEKNKAIQEMVLDTGVFMTFTCQMFFLRKCDKI